MKQLMYVGALFAAASSASLAIAGQTLTTGTGDGGVTVTVDGYGSFGGSGGSEVSDADYNPVGPAPITDTTFESGVAARVGGSGGRQFLATGGIGSSGNLPVVGITGNSTQANSSFSFGGLDFGLAQTVQLLTTSGNPTGSLLTQTYTINNNGANAINGLELIRYIDGDIGDTSDGGGRLVVSGLEIMFETGDATGTSTSTSFLGITGEGGTIPGSGRFEADSFSGLLSRIIAGNALDQVITGDSADADEFVDAGGAYDITLALLNTFDIAAGGSATYTTRTFFGTGVPSAVVVPPPGPNPNPIPLPAAAWAGIMMLGGMGTIRAIRSRRK
jgi:hypothetical protein